MLVLRRPRSRAAKRQLEPEGKGNPGPIHSYTPRRRKRSRCGTRSICPQTPPRDQPVSAFPPGEERARSGRTPGSRGLPRGGSTRRETPQRGLVGLRWLPRNTSSRTRPPEHVLRNTSSAPSRALAFGWAKSGLPSLRDCAPCEDGTPHRKIRFRYLKSS